MGNALQRARFLQPGDKLGKHDLIRQIAVGGMAELYLARTVGIEGFEKLAVVKRILPQYAANASFVHMFLNEARLAATFQHPNIAQVYDIGQEQGEFFFSMEYVHGEDLGRLVMTSTEQGIPISLDAALTLVTGLCAGLHHAHEKASPEGKPLNVVHRDVSPSNVLVSYDGAVKLVDFGIARVNSTPTSTAGGLKGKISYMSPEQCRGKATLDRRSDIFSVGTILYELTTGRLPFVDETEYGVLNQIVNSDAEPPSKLVPGYPPALEAIVMRSLARDPDQRHASARELQGALEDFALENRLRVSALVLARLMSTLFPQRLEEWDHARSQGAFFVEQHVVRTLIESGKTGSDMLSLAAREVDTQHDTNVLPPVAGETAQLDDDSTAVTAPPVAPEEAPTNIRLAIEPPPTSLPGVHERARTPIRAATPVPVQTPPAGQPRVPTAPPVAASAPAILLPGVHERPRSQPEVAPSYPEIRPMATTTPGVVAVPTIAPPRMATPLPVPPPAPMYVPLPPPQPGTLVSNSAAPSAVVLRVGDVTERVRIPTPAAEIVRRSKRGALVLVLAVAGAAVAALVTFIVLGSTSDPPDLSAQPAQTKPEPTAKAPATAAEAKPEPKAEVEATEPKAEAPVEKVEAKVEPKVEAKAEPKVEAKAEPKVEAKPAANVESKPAPKTEPKVEAKAEPKVEAKPAANVEPKPEPKIEPKVEAKADPKPAAVKAPPETKKPPVAVAKPKPKPKKPDPKEQQWTDDSPFMPVRPDKK